MLTDLELILKAQEIVRNYKARNLALRPFLDRVEDCIDRLSEEDSSWKEAVQRAWGRMEDAYAYAHYKGQTKIFPEDVPVIESGVMELERLLAEKAQRSS